LIGTIATNNKLLLGKGKSLFKKNKLTEQSDKISKLEHKTTEQGWTIKKQYAEINALYNNRTCNSN